MKTHINFYFYFFIVYFVGKVEFSYAEQMVELNGNAGGKNIKQDGIFSIW